MKKSKVILIFICVFTFIFGFIYTMTNINLQKLEAAVPYYNTDPKDRIHFINVGDGDAILIESQGKFGLVDGGRSYAKTYKYLQKAGVSKLSFILLSHTHSDHIGGLQDIISRFVDGNTTLYIGEKRSATSVENRTQVIQDVLANSGRVIEYATSNGNNAIYRVTSITNSGVETYEKENGSPKQISGGHKFTLNNFSFLVLNREIDDNPSDDNRNSLVLRIQHANQRTVLLTGDMEKDDEGRMICTSSYTDQCRENATKEFYSNIDILKLGHHGAYNSSRIEFLDHVKPKIAFITHAFESNIEESIINTGALKHLADSGTEIYLVGYDEESGHDFDSETNKEKSSILVNFIGNGYTISNATGGTVDNIDYIKRKTGNWVVINLYNQTRKIHLNIANNDGTVSKGMRSTLPDPNVTSSTNEQCFLFESKTGIMLTNFRQWDGKLFYFDTSGGARKISKSGYTFNNNNTCDSSHGYLILAEGLVPAGSKRYYYVKNNNVYTGWKGIKENNVIKRYYFESSIKNGSIDNQTTHGLAAIGFRTLVDNKDNNTYKFYFGSDGIAKMGWFTVSGNKYYSDTNARIYTGFHTIGDSKIYYFKETGTDDKGAMQKGWVTVSSQKFNLGTDGVLKTGWYTENSKKYYLRTDAEGDYKKGSAVVGTSKVISGKKYYFDNNGVCTNVNGIVEIPTTSYCKNPAYSGSAQIITNNPATGYTFSNNSQTNVGTYEVTAKLSTGYSWPDGTKADKKINCSIAKKSITSAKVSAASQTYTGSALTPEPTVTLDGKTLNKNTDYTVSYSNNIEEGEATITITGKGNYKDTATGKFTISSSSTTTSIEKPTESNCINPEYDGEEQVITNSGSTGYIFIDNVHTNVGTYEVTAQLISGYVWDDNSTTDVKFSCSIQAKSISTAEIEIEDQTYTGSALTPEPIVLLDGEILLKEIDYTVSYSNNIEVGEATITITGKGNYRDVATSIFNIEPASTEEDVEIVDSEYVIKDGNTFIIKVPSVIKFDRKSLFEILYIPETFVIKDKNNNVITNSNQGVGTNFKIVSDNKTYTIILRGDINGDGELSIIDLINIYGYMNSIDKGTTTALDQNQIIACDFIEDNIVDILDLINVYSVMKAND